MNRKTEEIRTHWAVISPLLSIRNEQEYDLAVQRLNNLLDEVGGTRCFNACASYVASGEACTISYQSPNVLLFHESSPAHIANKKGINLLPNDTSILYGHNASLCYQITQRGIPALSKLGATHPDN